MIREIRLRAHKIVPPVVACCLLAYFAFHTIQGEHGWLAWRHLKQELAQGRASETTLAAARTKLARWVHLLQPEHLDPDLLEERAHAVLGFGAPDEVVILLPKRDRINLGSGER